MSLSITSAPAFLNSCDMNGVFMSIDGGRFL